MRKEGVLVGSGRAVSGGGSCVVGAITEGLGKAEFPEADETTLDPPVFAAVTVSFNTRRVGMVRRKKRERML